MYTPIKEGGLAAEIVNFFLDIRMKEVNGERIAWTLHDFLDENSLRYRKDYPDLGLELRRFIQPLVNEGLLFHAGFDPGQRHPYNERFISYDFNEELAAYGSYDFVVFGFQKVREHFKRSVIPLVVTQGDKVDVGSGFLMSKARLITAAHCLPEGAHISIPGWNPAAAPLKSINAPGEYDPARPFILQRGKIDLAVLQFESNPFPNSPEFGLWRGETLEEILSMGYPPMRGFEAIPVANTGQIISEEHSTARNQPFIIFSARVKGGNSGEPILNRLGKVVGMVTNILTDEEEKIDSLGYGLATPAQTLADLFKEIKAGSSEVLDVKFDVAGEGIVIRKQH